MGGFSALRAATFEKRLTHVVSFGGFYDGLDVQFSFMNAPVKRIFTFLYQMNLSKLINRLIKKKMSTDNLANWAISHGMYITRKDSPYEFYRSIEKHHLDLIDQEINQKVLLLAGEEDHYIPHWQHEQLKNSLTNSSLTSRMFTKKENREQHFQVGNYEIALDTISKWLKDNY